MRNTGSKCLLVGNIGISRDGGAVENVGGPVCGIRLEPCNMNFVDQEICAENLPRRPSFPGHELLIPDEDGLAKTASQLSHRDTDHTTTENGKI
jgi:hypothetical protein